LEEIKVEIEVLRKFSGNTNITSFYGVYGIKVSRAEKASRTAMSCHASPYITTLLATVCPQRPVMQ
jgi:hypothetical protein